MPVFVDRGKDEVEIIFCSQLVKMTINLQQEYFDIFAEIDAENI